MDNNKKYGLSSVDAIWEGTLLNLLNFYSTDKEMCQQTISKIIQIFGNVKIKEYAHRNGYSIDFKGQKREGIWGSYWAYDMCLNILLDNGWEPFSVDYTQKGPRQGCAFRKHY